MGMANYLQDALADHVFRTATFSKPTYIYVALFTTAPTNAGGGVEVGSIGTGYLRVACNPGNANWNDSGTGLVSNNSAVTFATPTADWGSVVAFALFDASTSGNMLGWGNLGAARNIVNGDGPPSFAAGALTVQFG